MEMDTGFSPGKIFNIVVTSLLIIAVNSVVALLVFHTIRLDNTAAAERLKAQQALVESINGRGEVVEIYSYRTGTKTANYRYPVRCVVEAVDGTRIVLNVGENAPVTGDVWEVCMKGSRATLCSLIKRGRSRQ